MHSCFHALNHYNITVITAASTGCGSRSVATVGNALEGRLVSAEA